RTTVLLVIALLFAVAGLWWLQSAPDVSHDTADDAAERLFDLQSDDIVGYEIKSGDQTAASFEKIDGVWRMTAPFSGPANVGIVAGDVSRILNLTSYKAYGPNDDPPGDDITALNAANKAVKL